MPAANEADLKLVRLGAPQAFSLAELLKMADESWRHSIDDFTVRLQLDVRGDEWSAYLLGFFAAHKVRVDRRRRWRPLREW